MCVATAPARVGTRYMDALAGEKCKAAGKAAQQSSGRLKSQQEPAFCVRGKSLKKRRKAAMKWRGESGVLASDMARGKNSKTFQFLSSPLRLLRNGVRGDPNKFAHPVVNSAPQRRRSPGISSILAPEGASRL